MNLLGAFILTFLTVTVLAGGRKAALIAMAAGVLFLTQSQSVKILGINMFAVRFLEVAAFVRVVARREFSPIAPNHVDRTLLLLYGFMTVVYLIRANEGQAYVIGCAVDALLCYFAFRGLVASLDNLTWFLKALLFLLLPYAVLVLIECLSHHNPFDGFGGEAVNWVRNGRPRCIGSFRNPDLLGTLGSSFLPLYISLGLGQKFRKFGLLGIFLCLFFVWASNSGGPICSTVVGLVGWCLWSIRLKMQVFRRSTAAVLILVAMLMKAPVWYLLARASQITGGEGWHRSYLLDVTFQHLNQWWLAGMPAKETSDWFPYQLVTTGSADITNQFVGFGLTAGLGAVLLFILLLTRTFSYLGKAMAILRNSKSKDSGAEFCLWGLGVMLAVHIATWFGISYFDQFYVLWFMQLAAISSICGVVLETPTEARQPSQFIRMSNTLEPDGEAKAVPHTKVFPCGDQA